MLHSAKNAFFSALNTADKKLILDNNEKHNPSIASCLIMAPLVLNTVTMTRQTCSIISFLGASIQSYPHLLPLTLTDLQHLMNALKASFALNRRSLLKNIDVSKSNGPDKISG